MFPNRYTFVEGIGKEGGVDVRRGGRGGGVCGDCPNGTWIPCRPVRVVTTE